jgi:hypothetical protein
MTPKEKKAFVARMKKGKKDAGRKSKKQIATAKGYLSGLVGGVSNKNMIAWLKTEIKMRTKNPKNFSSDYSRGELRGYKEALAQLTGKPTRFGR